MDSLHDSVAEVAEKLEDVKPKLRGWLHLGTAPLTLAAGIVLIALSPDATTRVGSVVFTVSALLLFTVSAIYHTGTWSPRVVGVPAPLRPLQHLHADRRAPTRRSACCSSRARQRWCCSRPSGPAPSSACCSGSSGPTPRAGSTCRSTSRWAGPRSSSSRRSSTGATASASASGSRCSSMIVVGGALYTLGGAVYGFRLPNPSPRWFGFHEVFHSFTVLAFVATTSASRWRRTPCGSSPRNDVPPASWWLSSDATCEDDEVATSCETSRTPDHGSSHTCGFQTGAERPPQPRTVRLRSAIVVPRPCSMVIIEASCLSAFSVRANDVSASSGLNRCRAIALA